MNISLIIKIIVISILYYVSAKAVAHLSLIESGSVFAIWPPTGIALCALLLYGYRIWPGIFIGAFILNLTLSSLIPSLQIAMTNTLGPVIGFWFLQKFRKQNIFESISVMVLFIASIIIASVITASGGTLTLFLHNFIDKQAIFKVWNGWFIGDLIGFLLIAPLIETINLPTHGIKRIASYEGALMTLVLTIVILILFGPIAPFNLVQYPVVYFLLPPLIWATLRFEPTIAVLAVLITTLASIYGTILGYGPFIRDDISQTLLLIQSFNGVLSITILMMAAIFHERNCAHHNLNLKADELNHRATYDELTGIPNRTLFLDRLTHSIEKAKRDDNKLAVLFIDLDHFKEINDSLRHDVGDIVLIEVSKRLNSTLRKSDTLARLGGDEFTIIIESIKDIEVVVEISNKIISQMREPIFHLNQSLYVTTSIGISIYPDDGDDVKTLQRNADSAMYKAKAEGRDNYKYYNQAMTQSAFEHIFYESQLRNSLKTDELVVYYQPQIDLLTNRIIGMEALVRWKHPTLGLIMPSKFVPIAESTGLIVQVGEIVLNSSLKQIVKCKEMFSFHGRVSVNLSTKQLEQDDIITTITQALAINKCKPQWLELEVTEGYIMKNPNKAIETLERIRNLGITISIDDFGTGYSSLSYLKKLPIHTLKIDKSFVDDCHKDPDDQAIIKTIIALAQQMNLSVIAEGVEFKEQQDFLVHAGCTNIQGYIFSKPVPDEEFTLFLKQWS